MNTALSELAARFWDSRMAFSPTWANLLGDHRFDDQIEDMSLDAEDDHIAELRDLIRAAEALDPSKLAHQDAITRELLISEAESDLVDLEHRTAEFLADPHIGPHVTLLMYAPQLGAAELEHAEAFVARYDKVGVLMDQAAERLRHGVAHRRTPAASLVDKSIAQLDRYLDSPIDGDPWLMPRAPASFSADDEADWRHRLKEKVVDVIRPAYGRYRDTLAHEVAPVARPQDQCGVCWLPDGSELYGSAITKYTSLSLSAEEIHQIGLEEMAALSDEYRRLGEAALGTSDLTEIFSRLRSDPELRFETPTEIKDHAERAMVRAVEAAPDWFGVLPEAPCVVDEIPAHEAKEAPMAYYMPPAADGSRPGIFFVNTADPHTRTRYEAEALAFHEGVPGHHFQIALAQEIEDLPDFRKHALLYAYVEGWGLYTERLADEMGLYSGDLDRMGILSFDSWRAGRLVVDTGMHALGWSRQQAINYLAENSPQQSTNIDNEVDRYIGYFGQALSYKAGQREFLRIRDRARDHLGDRFDIKAYHDTMLGSGPTTLPVLGRLVEEWIEAGTN